MKPHRFSQMVNEVRELALQYGQMEQFRCRVADLLGKYIHVDHESNGAPAVVVPEPDGSAAGLVNIRSWIGAVGPVGAMVWVDPWEAMKVAGVRAIPADRVLGEGMVGVDRRVIEKFTSGCGEWMPGLGRCGDQYPGGERQLCAKCMPLRNALRANHGGAAT